MYGRCVSPLGIGFAALSFGCGSSDVEETQYLVEACNEGSAPCLVVNTHWAAAGPQAQTWLRCDSERPVRFRAGGFEGAPADWTLECLGDEASFRLFLDTQSPLPDDGRAGGSWRALVRAAQGDAALELIVSCESHGELVGCLGVSVETEPPNHDTRVDFWLPVAELPPGTIAVRPHCDLGAPECCEDADHQPCRDLPELECSIRSHCKAILGRPWHAPEGRPVFVGCQSLCPGGGADGQTCVLHPDAPDACFFVEQAEIPDGWTEVAGCTARTGQCGLAAQEAP